MSLNPSPVTDFRPEVELMHLLYACADIIVTFETDDIEQTVGVRLNVILFF